MALLDGVAVDSSRAKTASSAEGVWQRSYEYCVAAMISQCFFTAAICPMRRAVRLCLVFPVPADVRDMSESHDHPAAVFACRKFAQVPRSQAARLSTAAVRTVVVF
jgi:hypothetical protein